MMMTKLLLLLLTGWTSTLCAQQIYQIRADSVRIYNVCDTAELIIENRTQGVNGFLYNKGAGRTEFRKVRLEKIGDSRIAITGQDTSTRKQDCFDTNSSLAITMKAVQELSTQNEALQKEVAELKAIVKQLLAEKK